MYTGKRSFFKKKNSRKIVCIPLKKKKHTKCLLYKLPILYYYHKIKKTIRYSLRATEGPTLGINLRKKYQNIITVTKKSSKNRTPLQKCLEVQKKTCFKNTHTHVLIQK